MIVMVLALLLLLSLMLIIVPMLINQFNNMVSRIPQIVDLRKTNYCLG